MNGAPEADKRSGAVPSRPKRGIAAKPWWPWIKRIVTIAFFAVVAYLLFTQARSIEWGEVFATVRRRPVGELLLASLTAAASYGLYSCFDLLGRHATGHRLRTGQVMTVNFVSYAFNLNMGALVGGVAFRYRLYSQLGLETETTTRVLVMSMLTNWLGYLLLGGLAFALAPLDLPPHWKIGMVGLRMLGVLLLVAVIAYLLLCAFSRKRTWLVREYEVTLPSTRLALLQLLLSAANWLLIAATVYILLQQKIAFPTVLSVLLVGAIAGVITHVPAGLGVLEVVFVTLLSQQMHRSELLASLLVYRAIYYLAPLAVATLVYLLLEANLKKEKTPRTTA